MDVAIVSFPCEKCGKNFEYKYALKRHAKYCGDAVPETCRNCKKVLKNHSSLLTHERRCYGPDTELPCLHCNKFFRQTKNLNRHLRTCHGKNDSVRVNTDVTKINQLERQKFEFEEKTENIIENNVSEEIYTLRFGTEFDDSDVSVCKLASPRDAVCKKIKIESSSEAQSYVFEYEDSSDEEVLK